MALKEITSLQHPLVKRLVKLRQNRGYRYSEQSVVIEGIKMVREIGSQTTPHVIMTQDPSLIPELTENVILVTEQILKKISGTQNPEGIVAEVPMPSSANMQGLDYILALDGISDPGNMGTLLRTALALDWKGAFILEGCCDPFNDKAQRAAKGATFRLPIAFGNWTELQNLSQENGWQPYLADLEGESLETFQPPDKMLLVLGNEAHGASETAKMFCQKLTIPMSGQMESLNVSLAGGIIMYITQYKLIK